MRKYHKVVKQVFDRGTKKEDFQIGDLVLKWDAQHQDPGKHSKFDALWLGPFRISNILQKNTFELQHLDGTELFGGPFNGCFSKNSFTKVVGGLSSL